MVLIVLEPLEEAEGSPVEDFTSGALQDNFLIDFRHFCRLSGEREDIPYDELALAYRFQELDPEDTGYVTVGDFTYDSLWALLKRRYSRARALFRAWDEEDTFVSGDLSVVCGLARAEARRRGLTSALVRVVWGDARWGRAHHALCPGGRFQ